MTTKQEDDLYQAMNDLRPVEGEAVNDVVLDAIRHRCDHMTHPDQKQAQVDIVFLLTRIEALERERVAWKDTALKQAKALGAARVLDDRDWAGMPVFVKAAQALDIALITEQEPVCDCVPGHVCELHAAREDQT